MIPATSPTTASESVTRVNAVSASPAVSTREIEVVIKELEMTVPESNNGESNNSSSVSKVLSLKTDLLANVQLGATGTHLHALLQHTDLGLLDLPHKVIAFCKCSPLVTHQRDFTARKFRCSTVTAAGSV